MNSPRKHILAALIAALAISSQSYAQIPEWPNPVAEQVVPYLSTGVLQGPMLGRPAATSMRVWIRTEEAMDFEIRYSARLPLSARSPSIRGKTLADDDHTGVVDLKGLKPFTRYYYGVVLKGHLADTRVTHTDSWPSFRTLP